MAYFHRAFLTPTSAFWNNKSNIWSKFSHLLILAIIFVDNWQVFNEITSTLFRRNTLLSKIYCQKIIALKMSPWDSISTLRNINNEQNPHPHKLKRLLNWALSYAAQCVDLSVTGERGSVFSSRPLCSAWPGYPELILEWDTSIDMPYCGGGSICRMSAE